jgi:hypothetical protein
MLRRFAMVALLFLAIPSAWAGEVLDGVVATVDGHPLLQSDLDDEVRFESFMSGRALSQITPADVDAALDRLIDRELIKGQVRASELKSVAPGEVDKKVAELKAEYVHHGEHSWAGGLAAYGISESLVRSHVEAELIQLRVVDEHLRPSVQIDSADIKAYYEHQLLPNLPAGKRISLDDATPQIRELLVQKKINELLDSWLEALRAQAEIQRFESVKPEAKRP